MSTIQGSTGDYTQVTGFNGKITSHSSTLNITTVETTGFDDKGYAVHEPAKVDMNGTASGTLEFDAATTQPAPSTLLATTVDFSAAKGSLTLQYASGCTMAFTAVMQSVGMGMTEGGKSDLSHSFQSTGAITITWDETP